MKITLSIFVLGGALLFIFILGCGNTEKSNEQAAKDINITNHPEVGIPNIPKSYIVLSADKLETSNKAQVKVMAYLTDDFKDKVELEKMLSEIYESYRHQEGYNNFSEPTVVAAYLFGSEKLAKNDPSAWLGMLIKGPHDITPNISYNEFKVNAALGLKDDVQSEDEIQLTNIKKLLTSRNIDLCGLSQMINDIELNSIHKADKLYPDYGVKHDEYADQLIRVQWQKLEKKYRLTEKEINRAGTFASVYCK